MHATCFIPLIGVASERLRLSKSLSHNFFVPQMIMGRCTPTRERSLKQTTSAPALRFSVLNWFAWAPDTETRAAWCRWSGGDGRADDDSVPAPALPMMLRRRLSPFGQQLVKVIAACADGLPPTRYVLSTRHGELSRALTILSAIESEALPSPTDFSMSIHHALVGLLSIHAGNRLGHTALSAGHDSFANGLLEAAACVAERPEEPVIVAHADAPLPESYQAFRGSHDATLPLIVALALGRPTGTPMQDVSVEIKTHKQQAVPSASMPTDFLRFFLSNAHSAYAIGQRVDWMWRRVP